MGFIDGPTLILLLVSGISLGLYGAFGIDLVPYTVGETHRALAYQILGFAGVWQLFRQPWWHFASWWDSEE
jgi:uncharacterized membrane protein YuzA (DUF378 family)